MALIIARGINGLRPLSLRPLSLSSSKRPRGVGLERGGNPTAWGIPAHRVFPGELPSSFL